MNIISSAFESAREVLGWAEEAIAEFDRECRSFFFGRPLRKVIDIDTEARQQVVKLMLVTALPPTVNRRATEALNHIKHSFDQSIFAARRAIGKENRKDIFFPWATDPTDLEYRLGAKSKKPSPGPPKIPPELWPVLRTFEPYPRGQGYAGGDDVVRELAQVANRKHTVRLTFNPSVLGGQLPAIEGIAEPGRGGLQIPMPRWDAVNNEVVLVRAPLGLHIGNDTHIAFNIAFNEAPPLEGLPVVETLRHFLAKAKSVAKRLEEEAARIVGE